MLLKTNGSMSGLQAKNILQQTGLSQTLLQQIWLIKKFIVFPKNKIFFFCRNLADNDKDGRLTADEFVIAMHCCDIARTGQTLPIRLPR